MFHFVKGIRENVHTISTFQSCSTGSLQRHFEGFLITRQPVTSIQPQSIQHALIQIHYRFILNQIFLCRCGCECFCIHFLDLRHEDVCVKEHFNTWGYAIVELYQKPNSRWDIFSTEPFTPQHCVPFTYWWVWMRLLRCSSLHISKKGKQEEIQRGMTKVTREQKHMLKASKLKKQQPKNKKGKDMCLLTEHELDEAALC